MNTGFRGATNSVLQINKVQNNNDQVWIAMKYGRQTKLMISVYTLQLTLQQILILQRNVWLSLNQHLQYICNIEIFGNH